MGRFASDTGGGDFKPAPEGTHVARCVGLIDIGTHHGEYQGTPTVRNQVIVRWELPNEIAEYEGQKRPLLVSKFYTNSLGEKANLRKDLVSWRGKEFTPEELMKFDLQNILDKPCLLTVVHNDKGKAKVTAVSGMAKGMACPPAANEAFAFWMDEWDGSEDDETFADLPDGFQKLIKESDEYHAMFEDSPPPPTGGTSKGKTNDFDDDIPF